MRRAYQTDLSDEEWEILEPYLPVPRAPGRPRPPAAAPLARDPRRRLLCGARRLRLAAVTSRLPAVEDRLPLLPGLAHRRHLGAAARGPSPKGPGSTRTRPTA